MDVTTSTEILADIFGLIAPADRAAFRDMLEHELRGRKLTGAETRRIAEHTWHKFLRDGWYHVRP